jgi:4-hydroxy-4-methyl-2-oxoglutarate aldolase
MVHVVRSFVRPTSAIVEAIAQFAPSTLHEAQGRRGDLDSRIKPVAPGMKFCGPALTASCHIGDNLMIFEAINLARPGDILVLSAGNNPDQGGFGEVLANTCLARGVAAFVTDAGVRDGAALRALGFPVFSLGLCMRGTTKETIGTINQPVVIGGQLIRPGDIVAGDDDGVVVVRAEDAGEVAKASQKREEYEAKIIEACRQGRNPDVSERQAVMKAKGCAWSS